MTPDSPVVFWQYFDIYVLSVLTIVIYALLAAHKRKNGELLTTISQTVAYSKSSAIVFAVAMIICYPLYYAFLWFWVGPRTHMPAAFYYLIIPAAVAEAVFVLIPATMGKRKYIHIFGAAVVGLAMFLLALLILIYGAPLHILSRILLTVFILIAISSVWLLRQHKYRKHTFTIETTYVLTFLIAVSFVAHL